MKVKTLSLLAGAGSLLIAGTASANFLGLTLELVSENATTGAGPSAGFGPSTTYRIYANFENPSIVAAVAGTIDAGMPSFFSLQSGNMFNQVNAYGNGQVTPPSNSQLTGPNGAGYAVDSYFSSHGLTPQFASGTLSHIATPVGPDGFGWTGSFDSSVDWSWFIIPDDATPSTQVLLAQLTVSGHASDGTVGLFEGAWGITVVGEGNLFDWDGGTGGDGSGLSYFTNIPAPGVLALLGIAGLVGARRRRA